MIFAHADYAKENRFSTDVVVIGTGAGGAVVGTELAESGRDVLFVEEGSWIPTESFNPYASESIPRLYRDCAATVIFGTPPIPYVEGRAVGGSTVINGGMAYRPPERVLDEWSHIAPELSAKALEPLFERVERRVHVARQSPESIGEDNRLMTEGAKKMGWHYTVNQRNQEACVGANNCGLGCPTGAKQSTLVSYMPRAMAAGARCLTELRVERLLIEGGRAVGVVGRTFDPHTRKPGAQVTVRARAVVVACGAVQTPFLLLREKVGRPSRQLGKNFLCHPNAKVLAVYPHDVHGWRGVSQNTQIREFHEDGILFAENFVSPSVLGAYMPFHGARAWDLMQRYNQMIVSGVLVEDSSSGTVSRTPFGIPYVRYDITPLDHQRFLRGIKLLSEMHFAMGAEKVMLPFFNQHSVESVDELGKIDELQTDPSTLELFTPHLMGTARMGSRPESSVVSPSGELWDLPGCYVADASLFPTAIGVNPQITIMALATRVAERLELAKKAA
jgi:choline dehydrogenase-like flavoprotein